MRWSPGIEGELNHGETVIVPACHTAISSARQGTLLDVGAFDLAK